MRGTRPQSWACLGAAPGFEEALRRTKHKNATGRVPTDAGFPEHPPCCRVRLAFPNSAAYECVSPIAPQVHRQAVELSPADNRAAWESRVGAAIVSSGGDVFDVVPATGFNMTYKNPCWFVPANLSTTAAALTASLLQEQWVGAALLALLPHHWRVEVRHNGSVPPPEPAPALSAEPQQGPALLGRGTHDSLVPGHLRTVHPFHPEVRRCTS